MSTKGPLYPTGISSFSDLGLDQDTSEQKVSAP